VYGFKTQDLLLALKLAVQPGKWSYPALAAQMHLSAGEVHASVKRLQASQFLLGPLADPQVQTQDLYLFLLYGLRHICPPERGELTRGIPTAYAAPPLAGRVAFSDPPPVWPTPDGPVRGMAFTPLYRSAPAAAAEDPKLYELLALADALRAGRVRERNMAARELAHRLGVAHLLEQHNIPAQ
jgi:hypothetical protein